MSMNAKKQINNLNINNHNFKGYLIFWFGQLISLLGSNIVQFTIIWWITVETGSELMLAISTFIGFGPQLLLTPFAGVLVDRWSRKKIIVMVDFLQAMATIGLIYSFIIEVANIWFILSITALRGILQAFQRPAIQAIIPLLVPRNKLSRINGLSYLFNGFILMIGPVLAALLLEVHSLQEILWIDVLTFFIAMVPTIIITIPELSKKERKQRSSYLNELSEGIKFIQSTKGLISLLAIFTAANFFLRPLYVLLPLFVQNIHFGGVSDLAFLFSTGQLGMVISSLIMSTWKGFKKNTSGVALGIFIMYLGFIVCVLCPVGNFQILMIGMFIVGFGLPIANVSSQTIWQHIVPPAKLGRIYSVRLAIAQGSGPIAIILSGVLGEVIGINFVLIISVTLGMSFLAYSLLFTNFRALDGSK
ncbi:MAG: MFS transporter [Candidatus Hodarchaeales archaeon]